MSTFAVVRQCNSTATTYLDNAVCLACTLVIIDL